MNREKFQDKVLRCQDCGQSFTFTGGEGAYYWSKGLSVPRRCKPCRQLRKRTLIPDPELRYG